MSKLSANFKELKSHKQSSTNEIYPGTWERHSSIVQSSALQKKTTKPTASAPCAQAEDFSHPNLRLRRPFAHMLPFTHCAPTSKIMTTNCLSPKRNTRANTLNTYTYIYTFLLACLTFLMAAVAGASATPLRCYSTLLSSFGELDNRGSCHYDCNGATPELMSKRWMAPWTHTNFPSKHHPQSSVVHHKGFRSLAAHKCQGHADNTDGDSSAV